MKKAIFLSALFAGFCHADIDQDIAAIYGFECETCSNVAADLIDQYKEKCSETPGLKSILENDRNFAFLMGIKSVSEQNDSIYLKELKKVSCPQGSDFS